MQITDVRTFLVQDRERPERNYAFVKVYTDEGLTGLGEAAITGKELALAGPDRHVRADRAGDGPVPHRAHLADAVAGGKLDEDAARAYPFRQPGLRVLRREDNSVSDW